MIIERNSRSANDRIRLTDWLCFTSEKACWGWLVPVQWSSIYIWHKRLLRLSKPLLSPDIWGKLLRLAPWVIQSMVYIVWTCFLLMLAISFDRVCGRKDGSFGGFRANNGLIFLWKLSNGAFLRGMFVIISPGVLLDDVATEFSTLNTTSVFGNFD